MLSGSIIMIDELSKRNSIVAKAGKKYIPSHTMNISKALELYLKDDAGEDEQIPLIVTKETAPRPRISIILDQVGRLECPTCRIKMGLRTINEPKGSANLHGYKTCWECSGCGYEEYNYETVQELLNKKN